MSRYTDRVREALSSAGDAVGDVMPSAPRTDVRGSGSGLSRRLNRAERVSTPRQDLRKYWRQYQSVPLLRAPINQFRDDVMADGYRIVADDDRTEEFLAEWAEDAAVVNGVSDADLGRLLADIPVQLEARGTVLIEHAPAAEDPEKVAGLTLIPPETVTPYRRPNSSMLLRPEDTDVERAKLTDDDEAAAYVQYDRAANYGGDNAENRLTLNQVTKLTRDGDIGDVFGTSSIEAVSPRVEALRKMLADHEQAIESLAWGQYFVGFEPLVVDGEVIEWDESARDDVMDDLEETEPGSMIGHDGTVNVENIPGAVADIIDTLGYSTDYILSAMPAPTYSVGFEESINQFVVDGQETRHETRVDATRQEIERALTPVLRSVAEQNDYDTSGVALRLEQPEERSPVLSLSDAEVERIERYAKAVDTLSGDADPATLVDDETLRSLILQLSDDAEPAGAGDVEPLDLTDAEAKDLLDRFSGGSSVENGEAGA
jgi:hypothetical protein